MPATRPTRTVRAAPASTPPVPEPKPVLTLAASSEDKPPATALTAPALTTPPLAAPREPTEQNLLDALLSPEESLDTLARAHTLTLRGLIAWAEQRDIIRLRQSMRRLADDRADLIASRARVTAAHQLANLARAGESSNQETARKACVDLLRFRCAAPPEPDADPAHTQGDADPSTEERDAEAAFLAALEREAGDPPAHRPAPDSAPDIAPTTATNTFEPDRTHSEPAD